MKTARTSVVITGAGPVGLILAHLLGQDGVDTIVLEQAAELPDEPRAVGLDPESLRSFQALDLLDWLRDDILYGLTGDYLNGQGEVLFELGDTSPGPLGYPVLNGFSQPALVRKLAAALERYECVSLLYQHTLREFEQQESGVRVQVDVDGDESLWIDAAFLVGCDGGRSTVRSLLGIDMQGESNPQPWLVIDTREKEYDGKAKYRFYCDPVRPGMFIQTPHANRRWEWMVMPGENREDLLTESRIHALIAPYVDVGTVDIYRKRVYDFHAIIAERFQDGRVFLAGDAAHMTPPFAGQGLNSGIRDAVNLGWKFGAVIGRGAPLTLLDSYEKERWSHARELIDVAVKLGGEIQPTDPGKAAMRDAAFAELSKQPAAMDDFVGNIFKALVDRYFKEGCAVGLGVDRLSGRMLPQPRVERPDGETRLLDEHLGEGFSILGYNCDPAAELPEESLSLCRRLGATLVSVGSPEYRGGDHTLADREGVLTLFFGDEQPILILLRPDRFCMAVFDRNTARDKLSRAASLLGQSA